MSFNPSPTTPPPLPCLSAARAQARTHRQLFGSNLVASSSISWCSGGAQHPSSSSAHPPAPGMACVDLAAQRLQLTRRPLPERSVCTYKQATVGASAEFSNNRAWRFPIKPHTSNAVVARSIFPNQPRLNPSPSRLTLDHVHPSHGLAGVRRWVKPPHDLYFLPLRCVPAPSRGTMARTLALGGWVHQVGR